MLHFKAGIPYTQTMIWFGVLAYYWVREEIAYSRHREPNRVVAMARAWSHSLDLVHVQGMQLFGWPNTPHPGCLLNWTAVILFSLGVQSLSYLLAETPSH